MPCWNSLFLVEFGLPGIQSVATDVARLLTHKVSFRSELALFTQLNQCHSEGTRHYTYKKTSTVTFPVAIRSRSRRKTSRSLYSVTGLSPEVSVLGMDDPALSATPRRARRFGWLRPLRLRALHALVTATEEGVGMGDVTGRGRRR